MSLNRETETITDSAARHVVERMQPKSEKIVEKYQRHTMRISGIEIVFGSALMVLLFGGFMTRFKEVAGQPGSTEDVFEESIGM